MALDAIDRLVSRIHGPVGNQALSRREGERDHHGTTRSQTQVYSEHPPPTWSDLPAAKSGSLALSLLHEGR